MHIISSLWVSYVVSILSIVTKIDRVTTGPYVSQWPQDNKPRIEWNTGIDYQQFAFNDMADGCLLVAEAILINAFNSLRPRPNRRHFADDIFKCTFENENEWILPRTSLKFVPKVQINNIPALVQIMAWRRPGDKPLSEPMLVSLPTHICVTRPQLVNELPDSSLLQIIAYNHAVWIISQHFNIVTRLSSQNPLFIIVIAIIANMGFVYLWQCIV